MAAAWLLTFFALVGVAFGVFLYRSRKLSPELAAAGGGLLSGIALFWILPEIAASIRWPIAIFDTVLGLGALAAIDLWFERMGHSRLRSLAGPLLAAGAIHSFLDGWSVRVLTINPLVSAVVPLGLALHKIPEGLALGLVSRKSMLSPTKAFAASAGVEAFTLIGAFLEPSANRAGAARFGASWTNFVLALVAGSFLFLGIHTVLHDRQRRTVILCFAGALSLTAFRIFVK